jgi:hypothetical protein
VHYCIIVGGKEGKQRGTLLLIEYTKSYLYSRHTYLQSQNRVRRQGQDGEETGQLVLCIVPNFIILK